MSMYYHYSVEQIYMNHSISSFDTPRSYSLTSLSTPYFLFRAL